MQLTFKQKIQRAIIEHHFIRSTFRYVFVTIPKKIHAKIVEIRNINKFVFIKAMIKRIQKENPVENNKILFVTFRNTYDCNPRAICQEILDQNLPYELVQVARKIPKSGTGVWPIGVKLVKRDSYDFYVECSKAKIIIDNSINLASMYYEKKPDQVLIETWHGAIGMKRFDTASNKKWVKKALREAKVTDYCISNSKFETDLYKKTLWPNAKILEYGHPRNDMLFETDPEKLSLLKHQICKKYKIPTDRALCLYAPTFRDDRDPSPYNIPYTQLIQALERRFGGKWAILTRFHQRVKKQFKDIKFPKYVYNVSEFHDIQDLMAVSFVGITDYSSWICEYLLTGRPGFLFATDAQEYLNNDRGLVYPLDSTPFPLAKNTKQLIDNIKAFDYDKFGFDRENFLKKYGCVDDGNASKRTVEKIKEIIDAANKKQ